MIRDHLVKEKDLKKKSRLLIKLSPSLGSINQAISSEYQEWFFGKRSLLPSVGACRLYVGKPSMVLRRLTWKWWFKEHLRCLVEANQKGWSRKASNTQKKKQFMKIQVVFTLIVLSCKHWSKEEASQPWLKKVHLIISGSKFIWVKNGLYLWWLVFTKL